MTDTEVAALYVETGGVYQGLIGESLCWDQARDARLYLGHGPVVAHPPCQRWTNMARANYARWGGEHNRPGNDAGCFASALAAVRAWGGVLEHPGSSWAFREFDLPVPVGVGWQGGPREWVCEVWQSAYGHRARKRTWLFYCGNAKPADLNWSRSPGTHQVGHADKRGKSRNKPTLGKREASATPREFALALLSLARDSVT
jgi:hypothetical protein